MTATNLAPVLASSIIRCETDIVLGSMKLREGIDREVLSRFGDDVWNLDPAIFHVTARNGFRTIDFTDIAYPVERLTAKEYIYAWLNERLPDRSGRLRLLSARAALATLRQFMAFVREREGRFDAALIDQDLLDAYLALQKNRSVLPSRVAACLVVAGKIQYKHASVAMFDGYAGSSSSGFRQEVEQEHRLGQLDDIVVHYEAARRGERLAGLGASRVKHEIDRVAQEIGSLPGVIADGKRVKAMLAHLARTLHVGYLNDCFFEPATAHCLGRSTGSASEPILSNCAPDRCPNSCIAGRHLPAWQAAIAHAEAMLEEKRLSSVQRTAIRQDRDRMRMLIAPLIEERS